MAEQKEETKKTSVPRTIDPKDVVAELSRQRTSACEKDIQAVLGKHGCILVADATVRGNQFEVVGTRVRVAIRS